MAIIYSYPEGTPTVTDTVLGTIYDSNGNTEGNPTRAFAIQDIINLIPPGAQGATGATGPQGPTGQAGATGPSGSQGIPGPIGPAGLNWQGQWVSGGSYVLNDAVGYNGASWFCVLAISGGILSPPSDPTHWALLASQGAPGPQGPIGATGPGGALGPVGPAGPAGPAGTVGISSLNGLTDATQLFAVGTTGTDFNIVSSLNTHTFNIPNASLTARGFVSTAAQTFAGNKTFNNNVSVVGTFNLYDTTSAGYGSIGLNNNEFTVIGANSNQLFYADSVGIVQFNNGVNTQTLDFSGVTTKSYIFPNLNGTIALTSDIPVMSGFVPYTGATTNLSMGSFFVDASEYKFFDSAYSVYGRLFLNAEEFRFMTTPSTTLATINYGQLLLQGISTYNATITYTTLTANRTYALPNASGTIALTSNIPSLAGFVPYFGATQGVNLGLFSLTANSVTTTIDSTINGVRIGKGNSNVITNTVVGYLGLSSNTGGYQNTAVGSQALRLNVGGYDNTALGASSLGASTSATSNVAIGSAAGLATTTGSQNTFIGTQAAQLNTVGSTNVAIGNQALSQATVAAGNVAIGFSAGFGTTGSYNVAIGLQAVSGGASGQFNTAVGNQSMFAGSSGNENSAFGAGSLLYTTSGSNNTAIGVNALLNNTTGTGNVAIGRATGTTSLTGDSNIIIGYNADTSGTANTNSIVIGASATGEGNNSVVIGNVSITKTILRGQIGIGQTAPVPSAQVQIDSTTKGFLPPRMTTAEINAIVMPAPGLVVYNTTIQHLCFYNNTSWQKVSHTNM